MASALPVPFPFPFPLPFPLLLILNTLQKRSTEKKMITKFAIQWIILRSLLLSTSSVFFSSEVATGPLGTRPSRGRHDFSGPSTVISAPQYWRRPCNMTWWIILCRSQARLPAMRRKNVNFKWEHTHTCPILHITLVMSFARKTVWPHGV